MGTSELGDGSVWGWSHNFISQEVNKVFIVDNLRVITTNSSLLIVLFWKEIPFFLKTVSDF